MGNSSLKYLNFLNDLWPIILGGICLTSVGIFIMFYFLSSDDNSRKLQQLKNRSFKAIAATVLIAVFIGGSGAMVNHLHNGVGDHLKSYSKDSSWSINEGSLATGTFAKIEKKETTETNKNSWTDAGDRASSGGNSESEEREKLNKQGEAISNFFSNVGNNISNYFGNIHNVLSGNTASSTNAKQKEMNYSTKQFLDKVYNNQEVFKGN